MRGETVRGLSNRIIPICDDVLRKQGGRGFGGLVGEDGALEGAGF